jgi:hypothetical protein
LYEFLYLTFYLTFAQSRLVLDVCDARPPRSTSAGIQNQTDSPRGGSVRRICHAAGNLGHHPLAVSYSASSLFINHQMNPPPAIYALIRLYTPWQQGGPLVFSTGEEINSAAATEKAKKDEGPGGGKVALEGGK